MKINRNSFKIYLPLLIATALAFGIILGYYFANQKQAVRSSLTRQNYMLNQKSSSGFTLNPKTDKINAALDYVLHEYVDTVSASRIDEVVLPAITEELDPHSVYIPASEFTRYNEPLAGNFSGIGVQFNMNDDTIAIISTIPNGPSEIVGIQPGDRIITIDDSLVAGQNIPSDNIVKMLKGEKGTTVRVSVLRKGTPELIDFSIIRDDIPLYSVDVSYMIDAETGYIKISQFAQTTYQEFLTAVAKLKSRGMNRLILDLRGNGGGIMDAAIKIADEFLKEGQLIVYTEGRARPRNEDRASSNGILEDDELVILIDELSASASEILAGAIQDNDRGLIIGRRSFGKGLVQEQMRFTDGSALRLTVARYYTPTGRCIQKPYTDDRRDYYLDIDNRYIHGELTSRDSIHFADSLKFITPGGKVVYGGGGIMPDVFVPIDTTGITPYFNRVRSLGLIYRFAFYYTDLHRKQLSGFKKAEEIDSYLSDQDLMKQFIAYAADKGVKPNYAQIKESEKDIMTQAKAYIARNLIDNDGFYPIIRKIDNTLEVAIDTITSK